MIKERFNELVGLLLDDELSTVGLKELAEAVRNHPRLRFDLESQLEIAEFLRQSEDNLKESSRFLTAIHTRIGDQEFVERVRLSMPAEKDESPASFPVTLMTKWVLGSGLAITILIACILVFQARFGKAAIVVAEVHGEVVVTGNNGHVVGVENGHRFSGGTLESLSADAWVRLQYRDQTSLTISGRSLVTVSQNGQKHLNLRHGNLSGYVTKQPTGEPMMIQTPTAQMELPGSRFNVNAATNATRLVVQQGLVRIKRLADGNEAEVSANHQVTASIDVDANMLPALRQDSRDQWRANLSIDYSHGKWASQLDMYARQLKIAVAAGELSKEQALADFKAATLDDISGSLFAVPWLKPAARGKPGMRRPMQLAIISMTNNQVAPVIGQPGARLRVSGHVFPGCEIVIGLTANLPDGGFGGKFKVTRTIEVANENENSFKVDVLLTDFQTLHPSFGETPVGKELVDIWILATGSETRLQITDIELIE